MLPQDLQQDEEARLEALERLHVLDSPEEPDFDDLALIASEVCGTPIALISLVDANRQWFKAKVGMETRWTSRSMSFCGHAIHEYHKLEVEDALADERFHDNPLVTGSPGIRFYAGQPLVLSSGFVVGTLCVIDTVPRQLTEDQSRSLDALSRQVVKLLEWRAEGILAEQESRAKSDFIATLSHEIRTPLSALISGTHVLKETHLDGQARNVVSMMDTAGHSIHSILNRILELSKIESGSLDLDYEPFSPENVLQDAMNTLRLVAPEDRFTLDLQSTLPAELRFLGDVGRLRQIILNLLNNAHRYAVSRVTLSASVEGDGEVRSWRVTCTDDGPGVTAGDAERIFERHIQVEGSEGGAGLGLHIGRRLAELHGGSLTLEEGDASGACFVLEVPLKVVREDTVAQGLEAPCPSPRSTRVLLAEDSPSSRTLTQALLERAGYEVDVAESGEDAVERSREVDYDVILMDINMPILDGLEATRRIRGRAGHQPRIVALTANAFAESREAALEAGVDSYLLKPFRLEELISTVSSGASSA